MVTQTPDIVIKKILSLFQTRFVKFFWSVTVLGSELQWMWVIALEGEMILSRYFDTVFPRLGLQQAVQSHVFNNESFWAEVVASFTPLKFLNLQYLKFTLYKLLATLSTVWVQFF